MRKVNIPMALACVMLCLTLFTTSIVGGLLARYTTTGTGADRARVIRFGRITITETGDFIADTNKMPIVPGVDIQKKAVVEFSGSEAATYVFLEVSHTGNWTAADGVFSNADQMTWQIADGWIPLDGQVFYRELIPNETLEADIIRDGVIRVSEDITNQQLANLSGSISFRASVVQSNGFDSPEAAWASLQSKEEP